MNSRKNPDLTRETLIAAAMHSIHRSGFTATSLNDILRDTQLSKGALYHHFSNKKELGIAVVEELKQTVQDTWLDPLEGQTDPVSALTGILLGLGELLEAEELLLGCPLNNLAQEMSSSDEEFRQHLCSIYEFWRDGLTGAFEEGKRHGTVAATVDSRATASFLIASLSGGRGLAKTMNSMETMGECVKSLIDYLESLRS